jgi:hypothetical protein
MEKTDSMDVKPLNRQESLAYLAIVEGHDVSITGTQGSMMVFQLRGGRQYEVYDPKTGLFVQTFKYPIDAMSIAVRKAGGFKTWKIEG